MARGGVEQLEMLVYNLKKRDGGDGDDDAVVNSPSQQQQQQQKKTAWFFFKYIKKVYADKNGVNSETRGLIYIYELVRFCFKTIPPMLRLTIYIYIYKFI